MFFSGTLKQTNYRPLDEHILFGAYDGVTAVVTREEALDMILGFMPFLDDDALSRIVLQGHAIDDERHPVIYKDEDPDEATQALIDSEPEVAS
jgi:hypothetical protein